MNESPGTNPGQSKNRDRNAYGRLKISPASSLKVNSSAYGHCAVIAFSLVCSVNVRSLFHFATSCLWWILTGLGLFWNRAHCLVQYRECVLLGEYSLVKFAADLWLREVSNWSVCHWNIGYTSRSLHYPVRNPHIDIASSMLRLTVGSRQTYKYWDASVRRWRVAHDVPVQRVHHILLKRDRLWGRWLAD